jgi:hypothetical protein
MNTKIITLLMVTLLIGACKKEDQQPIETPTQHTVDVSKTTGTLIVKIEVDPQDWNGTSADKYLYLSRLYGGSSTEIILINGMKVENQSKYGLGDWNPGEYQLMVRGGGVYFTDFRTNVFQIQANKTTEFVVD